MSVKNYDPKEVSLILGSHIASGYADGTFIKVKRNNDAYAHKKGADGEGARAKSNDKSGEIELTLLQSSQTHDFLSGQALADEVNNGGLFPVLLKDNNGNTLCEGLTAWAKKLPEIEYGKEIADWTWVIAVDDLTMIIGGIS